MYAKEAFLGQVTGMDFKLSVFFLTQVGLSEPGVYPREPLILSFSFSFSANQHEAARLKAPRKRISCGRPTMKNIGVQCLEQFHQR